MAALSCRVRSQGSVVLVEADGRLDMASVPSMRITLLKCLADSPSAVIVDLSHVLVRELLALAVFPSVRRQTADWPPVPLLVCCLDPRTVPPRHRRRWLGETTVFDNLAEAEAAATRPDLLDRRVHAWLPLSIEAPVRARELVAIACRAWGIEHLLPAAEVIVSELAANAICHASGIPRLVIVRGDRYLHLVMRDGSRRMPVMVDDEAFDVAAEHGRGLRLVRDLAASWGAQAGGDGKAVWATLPLISV